MTHAPLRSGAVLFGPGACGQFVQVGFSFVGLEDFVVVVEIAISQDGRDVVALAGVRSGLFRSLLFGCGRPGGRGRGRIEDGEQLELLLRDSVRAGSFAESLRVAPGSLGGVAAFAIQGAVAACDLGGIVHSRVDLDFGRGEVIGQCFECGGDEAALFAGEIRAKEQVVSVATVADDGPWPTVLVAEQCRILLIKS